MKKTFKVCLVIPCFNVRNTILQVIKDIDTKYVDQILVIDDKCPQGTGDFVKKKFLNKVKVIQHRKNEGVGGATISGFRYAIKNNFDIVIKLDGDGQHQPKYIKNFINKLKNKNFNFCKGTRFRCINQKRKIPKLRFFGNCALTLATRINCANYNITDAVNGFIGIKISLLNKINLDKVSKDFFFEEDLLFHCSLSNFNLVEIQIKTLYFGISNLIPFKIIVPFAIQHFKNFITRYLVRSHI